MKRRIALSIDEQCYLDELFYEYEESRKRQYEYEKDAKFTSQRIKDIFVKNDIKKKKWKNRQGINKTFYIADFIKYIPSAKMKNKIKIDPDTRISAIKILKMIDNTDGFKMKKIK